MARKPLRGSVPLRSRFSKFSGQNAPAGAAFVAGNAANRRSSLSRVARPLSKVRNEPAVESCGRFTFAPHQIFGPISGPVCATFFFFIRLLKNRDFGAKLGRSLRTARRDLKVNEFCAPVSFLLVILSPGVVFPFNCSRPVFISL